MWNIASGVMKPMDVLRVATIYGAESIGLGKQVGSLEAGKLADLIVLDANPLENVRNTTSVRYTIVNGRIFDSATMNEIGNHPRTRKPFFFQTPGGDTWSAATSAAAAQDED
jgi:adenine deaminase